MKKHEKPRHSHQPILWNWSFRITPENIKKTSGFLCSEGIERDQRHEMD